MDDKEREELAGLLDDQIKLKKAQLLLVSNLEEHTLLAAIQAVLDPE